MRLCTTLPVPSGTHDPGLSPLVYSDQELLRILDYFSAAFGSEEYTFLNFGIEGTHHTLRPDGMRVLTDRGTEYCGVPDHHEYELYLAVENIDHTRTKARSPQTTGSASASTRRC
jgi:hypothetical protein